MLPDSLLTMVSEAAVALHKSKQLGTSSSRGGVGEEGDASSGPPDATGTPPVDAWVAGGAEATVVSWLEGWAQSSLRVLGSSLQWVPASDQAVVSLGKLRLLLQKCSSLTISEAELAAAEAAESTYARCLAAALRAHSSSSGSGSGGSGGGPDQAPPMPSGALATLASACTRFALGGGKLLLHGPATFLAAAGALEALEGAAVAELRLLSKAGAAPAACAAAVAGPSGPAERSVEGLVALVKALEVLWLAALRVNSIAASLADAVKQVGGWVGGYVPHLGHCMEQLLEIP